MRRGRRRRMRRGRRRGGGEEEEEGGGINSKYLYGITVILMGLNPIKIL
jgi:hypothetical protein